MIIKFVNTILNAMVGGEIFPYSHPRSYERLIALSRYRGMQTGVEFAETYRVIRSSKK